MSGSPEPRLRFVEPLAGAGEYDPGPAPSPPDGRPLIHLDKNEGPTPAASAFAALASIDPERLRRYATPAELERRIASREGLEPASVIVTNGGDEAIDRCCRLMLDGGRRAIIHTPGFEMIERSARATGAFVDAVDWDRGDFPVDAILERAGDDVGLVGIVTPNNPSGLTAGLDDIARIAAAMPHALVMVDLAYVEYHDPAFAREVLGPANVVTIRTFSKAWGLAGLRCGWASGPRTVVNGLRAVGGPFPVGGATLAAVSALLDDGVRPDPAMLSSVEVERTQLRTRLIAAGADVPVSRANFVTPRFESAARATAVADALFADGFVVRRFRGSRATDLRITVTGDPRIAVEFDASLSRALASAGTPVTEHGR